MPDRPRRRVVPPRAVAAWSRIYSRAPLRVKLIAAMLLLVTAALAGSGAVAATTLRSYLIGRVDAQLAAAQQPLGDHHGGPEPDDHGAGPSRLPSAYVVESYVSYLRRKIDTTEPRLLHTLRGVGYTLRLPRP